MELQNKNDYLEGTIKLKVNLEEGFLVLAERLYQISTANLWMGVYDSFELFLDELKVSPATASKLINVYKTFVIKFGMGTEELVKSGWSSLYQVIPLCVDAQSAKEWVEKSSLHTRKDLEIEVQEKKRGVSQYECPHKNSYRIEVCKDCGSKIKTLD